MLGALTSFVSTANADANFIYAANANLVTLAALIANATLAIPNANLVALTLNAYQISD